MLITIPRKKKIDTTFLAPIIVEEILKHEDFYAILGVGNTASDRGRIKAYWRRYDVQTFKLTLTRQMEIGGDLTRFLKRVMFCLMHQSDRCMIDSESRDYQTAGSYQDVFRSMFQQAAQQRRQQQQRNASLRYQLQVTLEDFYYGRTHRISITPPESYHHRHNTNHRKQKQVDVHIPKGSINGQTIVLSGEVDFNDDTTPGDLIFVLNQAISSTIYEEMSRPCYGVVHWTG